jgi:tRNA-binding protein
MPSDRPDDEPHDRSDAPPDAPPDARPDAQPDVGFAHFAAVDMRVGRVVDVQPFPEARKPAWKVTVDFGPRLGRRRTSAQVTAYAREDLLDARVVGAVNLGPKRIAGFTSEFLLLGAVGADGVVRLLRPDTGAAPGDRVS